MLEFFPRNDLTWPVEENSQNLEWLPGQVEAEAVFAEFFRIAIDFKGAEAQQGGVGGIRIRPRA
ncbi:MAG: hypothetical protein LC114_27600 [Bryobacterales bacterium]|nr:hypothetical protein [Bryobacterales bacterium]